MSEEASNPTCPPRAPAGVGGLDRLTGGGLPRGRTCLVIPVTGKPLVALQILARQARERGEPGLFVAFAEASERIREDVASFGWGLDDLVADHRLTCVDADLSDEVVADQGGDRMGLVFGQAAGS